MDSRGRLIGVNTMIYSPSGVSSGIGFAIPADTVKRVVNQVNSVIKLRVTVNHQARLAFINFRAMLLGHAERRSVTHPHCLRAFLHFCRSSNTDALCALGLVSCACQTT